MKQTNFWNILSNYGSKVWGLVSVFIFIPLYIKYLGIESYAVVGFYALLFGIISFADGGLSSAIIKEFSAENSFSYKYSLLRSIEKAYIKICLLIVLAIFFSAPLIASKWLTSDTISLYDLTYYIRLIGIGISLQLLSSLYFGSLFGLNYQVKANLIQITWNIIKSLGVVLALIFIKPTLEVFFLWQICSTVIYVFVLRTFIFYHLKNDGNESIEIVFKKIPKKVIAYISGMIFIAILSSINSQADKIVTSSTFSLIIYGYYSLASTLSMLPILISTPLAISVFPIFTRLSSLFNDLSLKICYQKASFLLNLLVITVGIILVLYTKEVLLLWTKNSIAPEYIYENIILIRYLTIGSCFLAFQLIPFYFLLSKGKTKFNIYQGIVQVTLGVPILILFVKYFGLSGAGISWIIINLGGLIFLNFIIFSKFIELHFLNYLKNAFFIPFFINLIVSGPLYFIYSKTHFSYIIIILFTGVLCVCLNIIYINLRKKISIFSIGHFVNFNAE